MRAESEDLRGSMRNMESGEVLSVPLKRRNSAQRYAWELKLIEGKVFTVNLTEDRSEIKVTRIA